MRTIVEGEKSNETTVDSGVPQGIVLGQSKQQKTTKNCKQTWNNLKYGQKTGALDLTPKNAIYYPSTKN
jgi:hypothetical protein